MNQSFRSLACSSVAAFALLVSGCVSSDPAMPTAPTPDVSSSADGSTLKVNAPTLQSPIGDVRVGQQPPYTLVASSVAGTFSQAPFYYRIEVHDSNGVLIRDSGALNSPSYTLDVQLDQDRRYTWRARAEYAHGAGPWSVTGSFLTPQRPPNPCGHYFDPVGIIHCWIGEIWDDSVGPGELIALTKAVAKDLNRAGIEGGPFGALRKVAGNNCEGYSCDIICAGQGGDQVQYDFLIADEIPVWGGGNTTDDGIRVDVCEIQEPDYYD